MQSQTEWVWNQLRNGRALTPRQAMSERGIMRLGARIWELREEGYDIITQMKRVYNRYNQKCYIASYCLARMD